MDRFLERLAQDLPAAFRVADEAIHGRREVVRSQESALERKPRRLTGWVGNETPIPVLKLPGLPSTAARRHARLGQADPRPASQSSGVWRYLPSYLNNIDS